MRILIKFRWYIIACHKRLLTAEILVLQFSLTTFYRVFTKYKGFYVGVLGFLNKFLPHLRLVN